MSTQKEVVIIGAGVIGCSIAYHLAKQGVASQIIERESVAAKRIAELLGMRQPETVRAASQR